MVGPGQPNPGAEPTETAKTVRAAQYVRMSTEHQQYSTENQADAIQQYADLRGIEIVRTYADEGRSGLSLDGRDAFKKLIDDVESGRADFEAILVYDVSRWGRFQDADEGGYGPWPALDTRHRASGADQRKICRQKCLESGLVQAQEEAGSEQAGPVDSE